jgi:hypothetical protein
LQHTEAMVSDALEQNGTDDSRTPSTYRGMAEVAERVKAFIVALVCLRRRHET